MASAKKHLCTEATTIKQSSNGPVRHKLRLAGWCIAVALVCITVGQHTARSASRHSFLSSFASPRVAARASQTPVLDVFQVYPPVLTVNEAGEEVVTDGSPNASTLVGETTQFCQGTIVEYSFANSYGHPFVQTYSPPACSFSRVTWNLTVTAAGRQFDRLAIVYLGDVEVFRTSTAEPTINGIEWTYLKDVTPFLSLLKQQQTIIFDLGNIVNDIYTSPFNVTLTAVYFTAEDSIQAADVIIPISSRSSAAGRASVFSLPPDNATNNIVVPRNAQRAVVTLSSTGQIDEEFWWSNVPSSTVQTFPQSGSLLGFSPFREVQLFIDGTLAGIAWPFPIIFTGGIVPGLWRPVVGIDAFDLKEDEVDITPFLPLLCDGRQHNFTIRVAGLSDDGKGHAQLQEVVGSYWLVTGKIFIWLDEQEDHITTGQVVSTKQPSPAFGVSASTTIGADGTNETLTYSVTAERSLSFEALINTSKGPVFAFWEQNRNYSNNGFLSNGGFLQTNVQSTRGSDLSSSGYAHSFSYPLDVTSVYVPDVNGFSIAANVSRGKDVQILGVPVFPTGLESLSAAAKAWDTYQASIFQGASLQTTQNGSAVYNSTGNKSYSFGSTSQDMTFSGVSVQPSFAYGVLPLVTGSKELFNRQVAAVNGSVVYDQETLLEQPVLNAHIAGHGDDVSDFVLDEPFVRSQRPA